MRCAYCNCELRGFTEGTMVERRVTWGLLHGGGPHLGARLEKVVVCRNTEECDSRVSKNRMIEAKRKEVKAVYL